MVKKVLLLLLFIFVLILAGELLFEKTYPYPQKIQYGVTFSPQYARFLGLDWKEVFIKSLDDLKIKEYRITTPWDQIEMEEGKLDFEEVDYMLSEIEKRDGRAILVTGFRQPRWPECHWPKWIMNADLSLKQEETLKYIEAVVQRYKNHKEVWAFQVENEPLLPFFGENCLPSDRKFLQKEVEKVRSLTGKPIVITDSGEFGFFVSPMQLSDILGTTLYRKTYDPIFKYKTYPLSPFFYNLKSFLVRNVFARNNQKTIVVELQAEPWLSGDKSIEAPLKQAEFFPVQELKDIIEYAKKTGFDTQYLWGVEWWYFMEKNGHPQYLEYAKTLFE